MLAQGVTVRRCWYWRARHLQRLPTEKTCLKCTCRQAHARMHILNMYPFEPRIKLVFGHARMDNTCFLECPERDARAKRHTINIAIAGRAVSFLVVIRKRDVL